MLAAHAALCIERGLPYRSALAAAYAAAALGVLAKGLIGIIIPALIIGAWLLARRRWRVLFALLWWPGIALFLLLTAPWFIAMQLKFADFAYYFFVVQHFNRFAAGGFNNVQPFWFYPALLILFCVPWLPWLARLPIGANYLGDPQRGPVRLLMLLWVLLVALFFSLPESKLVGYILPAVPPLAFLLAEGFALLTTPSTRSHRIWAAGTGLAAALGMTTVIWLSFAPMRSSREIALTLKTHHGPGDQIVVLNTFLFDLPFYAKLGAPVKVVDDWTSSQIQQGDSWRKELSDSGRFDHARTAHTLIAETALPALLCRTPVTWVIGSSESPADYPFLAAAHLIASTKKLALWRLDSAAPEAATALACTGRAGSDGFHL